MLHITAIVGVFITLLEFQNIMTKGRSQINRHLYTVGMNVISTPGFATACVSHGSTISKGLFLLSSKTSHSIPTAKSYTVISGISLNPWGGFFRTYFVSVLGCWKNVTKGQSTVTPFILRLLSDNKSLTAVFTTRRLIFPVVSRAFKGSSIFQATSVFLYSWREFLSLFNSNLPGVNRHK